MARNFIEYSQYIFDLLVGANDVVSKTNMRVLVDEEKIDIEKQFFLGLIIKKTEQLLHDVKICEFEYSNARYVVFVNLSQYFNETIMDELNNYEIFPEELNTGIFLSLVKDAGVAIPKNIDTNYLEEYILYQQEDPEYKGHSLEDLAKCFEPLSIFKIGINSSFIDVTMNDICYFIYCNIDSLIHLDFQGMQYQFIDMLRPENKIPKENIFLAYTATHWKHSFLELYRCIEGLYQLPRIMELKAALNLQISGYELVSHCFDKLGWRSKEEDAFCRLIKSNMSKTVMQGCSLDSISLFADVTLDWVTDDDYDRSCKKVAKKVYKLRNSLVHHTEIENKMSLNNNEWVYLFTFLICLVKEAFQNYSFDLP